LPQLFHLFQLSLSCHLTYGEYAKSERVWVSEPYTRCYTLPIGTRNAEHSEESAKGHHTYFLLCLEYQLMKIIQYRNSNATMLIQYGLSKTGFGSVLRYAITLIVTITESIATTIFRSLSFSILFPHFHKLIIVPYNIFLFHASRSRLRITFCG